MEPKMLWVDLLYKRGTYSKGQLAVKLHNREIGLKFSAGDFIYFYEQQLVFSILPQSDLTKLNYYHST